MGSGEGGRRAWVRARPVRWRAALAALALALCATPAAALSGPTLVSGLKGEGAPPVAPASAALFARPQAPPPQPAAALESRPAPRVERARLPSPGAEGSPPRSRDEARFSFCVRTCDGYYFPLGDLDNSRDLSLHEESCRAACPSAETVLFVSRGSRDIADAVSRSDGAPYTALPTAFLHRDTRVAGCSCKRPDGMTQLMSRPDRTLRPGDVLVTPEGARVVRRDGALPSFEEPGAATRALRRMIEARLGPNHAAAWRGYRPARAVAAALQGAPDIDFAPPPLAGVATGGAWLRRGFVALN